MPPVQAIKFNDWTIPMHNRADPFNLELRTSSIQPFRTDGGISVYGRNRKPVAEKIHTVSFVMNDSGQRPCGPTLQPDSSPQFTAMMQALLDGQGRLWFDNFRRTGPQVFSLADLNDLIVTPNKDNWSEVNVTIEWQMYNPILYRPQSSGYLTGLGYNVVSVPDAEFGESGDERVFAYWDVTSSPFDFTINTEGHFRTSNIIIRIESLAANGYTNPRLDNLTTEQWVKFGRTGSTSSHVLQAKCSLGPHRVRESTDDGASFVDTPSTGNIWSDTTISDLQVPLMELIPGSNSMRITDEGTPNFRLMLLWLPAYGIV